MRTQLKKPNIDKLLHKKYDENKTYKVYIEISGENNEGYIFMNPKDARGKRDAAVNYFIMTFHFQKMPKKSNPIFVIDGLTEKDFEDRINIINAFVKFHALQFAVSMDGLEKL